MTLFEPDSDVVCGPLVPEAPEEPVLDVDQIQGAVIPGFGTAYQHLFALRFADATRLRAFLAGPHAAPTPMAAVMTERNARRRALRAEQPRPRTSVMRAVALSMPALELLTPDAAALNDTALKAGMRLRS